MIVTSLRSRRLPSSGVGAWPGRGVPLLLVAALAAPACTQYHALSRDGGAGAGGTIGIGIGIGGSSPDGAVDVPGSPGSDGGVDRVDAPVGGDGGPGGTAALIKISPDSQNFGMLVQNRGSASQTFMVNNNGEQATSLLSVVLGGVDKAEFQVTADGCSGQILNGGGNCALTVRFAPTGVGPKSASVTVSAGTAGSAVAQLSGTSITQGTLAITPGTRVFDAVQQMTPGATQVFTVKNNGLATTGLLATTLVGGDNSNFSIAANACDGHTLAASLTCEVTVQFAPVTPGSKLITLSVAGAPGEVGVAQLSGTSLASPSITINPVSKQFNGVTVNQNVSGSFMISNPGGVATGTPSVAVAGATAADTGQFSIPAGANGCTAGIIAGGSCMISVRFAPTATGVKNGTLTVSANPGTSATATLTGTGVAPGKLSVSPLSQDFGSVPQMSRGATAVTFSVMNSGASPTGTLQASVVGSTEFLITQDNCSKMVLTPLGNCTVDVVFAPTTASPSGSLQILATNPADSASAGLTGTGLAPAKLAIAPAAGTFPDTVLNPTVAPTVPFTVRNTGGVAAGTGSGLSPVISGTNQADFSVVTGMSTCSGALAAGAQCTVVVAFSPKTTGNSKTATLTVNGTPGGPIAASLGGNGIKAASLSLMPAVGNAVAYGDVVVGMPKDQTFEVANQGQQPSSVLQIVFSNATGPGFSLLSGASTDCAANTPVAGDGKCNLRVHFNPVGRGQQNATLAVSAAVGGAPAGLILTGNGLLNVGLTANPSTVNLGNVNVNTDAVVPGVMIINGGDVATSVPAVNKGASTELTINSGCLAAIPAGGSCTLMLTFRPGAAGARSATVTVTVAGASTMFAVNATGVIPCGAVGQPCCTGAGVNQCGPFLTCASVTSTCACGGSGQSCCGGPGGTCSASGAVCGTSGTCGAPVGNGVTCQTSPQCMSNNCTSGVCCAAGQSGCNGGCVNLTSDNANCGSCGHACVGGKETCSAGVCKANDGQPCAAAPQCVSGNCPLCYIDRDLDGFGDKWTAGIGTCGTSICNTGFVANNLDCLDDPASLGAAEINPAATFHTASVVVPTSGYSPDPRDTSPDGWDWNCDDIRTLQYVTGSTGCAVGATCAGGCPTTVISLGTASCGGAVPVAPCVAFMCGVVNQCEVGGNGPMPQGCK